MKKQIKLKNKLKSPMKYSFGGDLGRFALDNLEQSTLGTLGLDFYKPKYDSDTMAKIGQVSQGIGQATNKAKLAALNLVPGWGQIASTGLGAVQEVGNTQFHRNGMNIYQSGNEVSEVFTKDLIPHNLNYLNKISENLVQYDGPTHQSPEGGIRTNVGLMDKMETVLKAGIVGNPTPFAFSDNLKISKEVQRQLGLPTNMRNKTIADASKFIENKYETKYNDMPIQRNTKDRMKQSLYTKLMNANKIEFTKNRIENGIQSKEDMSFDELNNQFQSGMEVDLFPKNQTYEWNTNNIPQEIPSQYMRNYEVRSKVPNIQAINGTNKTTNWTNYLDYSKNSPQNFMTEMENGELSTDFKIPFTGQKGSLYNISDYMPKEDIINSDMENRARNIKVNTLDMPDITAKMDENDKEIKDKQSNFWNSVSDLEKIGLGANALSTLGQGLTMLKKDKIPTFYNENSSQINNIMSDRRINMQPMINDLNSQYNAATSKDNSRSWNVQRGLNTNIYNQYAKSLGELGMKEQEMNNQYKSQYAETLNNLGMQNVQARTTQEELQARTDAARQNALRGLMANTGENLSNFAFTKNLADKTIQEGFKYLSMVSPDFGLNASNIKEFSTMIADPEMSVIKANMEGGKYLGQNAYEQMVKDIEALNLEPNRKAQALQMAAKLKSSK